ncbi:MAG: glycosyltransferase [Treponema sp.]|nr:glycosyltransferase [Spirochaetia bacterium]MDY2838870.1 glycosyltransferase [Treponema sp.]
MTPKISIIVPVYNVEKYLKRCIDSILAQTFTDFECILIDDGSPDNCPAICDEYAKADKRIKVIHQENKGVSAARNAGLDTAKGEWIGFVDSDDWIEPNMYEQMLGSVNKNVDVIICSVFGIENKVLKKEFDSSAAVKYLFGDKGFQGYVWSKIIRKEIIGNSRFDTRYKYMEDLSFLYEVFHKCNNFIWNTTPLYHYEQNETSCVHQKGLTEQAVTGILCYEELISSEHNDVIKKLIVKDYINFIMSLCIHELKINKNKKNLLVLIEKIKQKSNYVFFTKNLTIKRKILAILLSNSLFCKIVLEIFNLR